MKINSEIIEKIKKSKEMRLSVALALKVSERQVYNLIGSNSDNLTKQAAVLVYKDFGFKENQIFEPIKYKSISNN